MTITQEAAPRSTVLGLPRCPDCGWPALRLHGPDEPRLMRHHGRPVARIVGVAWQECLLCGRQRRTPASKGDRS